MYFYPSEFNDVYHLGGRRRDPYQETCRRQQAYERAQQRQRQQAALLEKERRRQEILQQRRQLYEQEISRRQQEEDYYRYLAEQQERARQTRMVNPFFTTDQEEEVDEEDNNRNHYVLLRGPYGRLYRVPHSELMEEKPRPGAFGQKGVLKDTVNQQRMQQNKEETVHEPTFSLSKPEPISLGFDKANDCNKNTTQSSQVNKKPKRKKVTFIVEDVFSEDEESAEDAASQSAWRNRHPAPGESWMEPINMGF